MHFIVTRDTENAVKRVFNAHRGGLSLPDETRVEAHGRFTRFIALEQFGRFTKEGVYHFQFVLDSKDLQATDQFSFTINPSAPDELRKSISAVVRKYWQYRTETKTDPLETLSYREALRISLSYLTDTPEAVWRDVCREFKDVPVILEIISDARQIGPGGIRVLD